MEPHEHIGDEGQFFQTAEEKGFEPLDGKPSTDFKSVALDHSATPPNGPETIARLGYYCKRSR